MNKFEFPAGTVIEPNERAVLVENMTLFNTQHNVLDNIWEMGFGFSNAGESLTLYNNYDYEMHSVNYIDSLPWQIAADGYGRTLEIYGDGLEPSLPQNWFAGCIGGSPGQAYSPCSEALIFSEINYNSNPTADAGDWIELYNRSSDDIDLSNWKFRDSDDLHTYTINQGTVIPAGEYLVLYSNYNFFTNRFPNVTNVTGAFNFGLGGNGDAVRLFDENGVLYQSVVYSNLYPWSQGADGNGYTLELVDYEGIFCDGSNWTDGCPEGSPGVEMELPCSTQTKEIATDGQLLVYPNPTTGIINLKVFEKPVSVSITDITGKKISDYESTNNNYTFNIDISYLNDGIYILNIFTDETVLSVKVIKQ